MALGSTDNNKKNDKKLMMYSPYGNSNTVSKVDPSRISFGYWNKLLKITITPMIGKNDAGIPNWDKDNELSGFLTHKKARIFASEIRRLLENPTANNNVGIISNETLITFSTCEEGASGLFLVLRKINKETGAELSKYIYEFNTNFHSSIRDYDPANPLGFATEFDSYKTLEVEELLTLLDTYVSSMTYATAYSVMDAADFNCRRAMDYLYNCAKALGVTNGSNSNSSNNSGNSVFNQRNNHSANTQQSSYGSSKVQHIDSDDLDDDLFGY